MSNEEVKQSLASNTIWNALERFSMLGIQLVCTFVLARFLQPSDFGLVGMLVVFTLISNTLIDSGFGQTIIREKEVEQKDLSTVFYFNLFIAIILYIVLYFLSPYIAAFYHQEILNDICKVTFLVIPFNALCLVPQTLLAKQLQFKKIFIVTFFSALFSCLIAVIIAFKTRNVWALVFQNVLQYAIKAIVLMLIIKWKPTLDFSFQTLRKYFAFSSNLLISGLIGNIFSNIYSILIGRFYTASDLGFYMQADRIKNVLTTSTTSVVQNVSYPILSKINNSDGDIVIAYKKIIKISIIFVGFIMSLLMGVSEDVCEIFMGDKVWRISGQYLFLLGVSGILYPFHSINQNILLVKGEGFAILKLEIIRRTLMLLILAVTVNFDIIIFVGGTAVYSFLLLFINLYYCGKPINYGVFQQLKDTMPIFFRLAIMVITALITSYFVQNLYIILRVIIVLCLSASVGIILFSRDSAFRETICLFKKILWKH